jgi:peptidyl-prolyl cis-trans isomerase A (cyclophilin A)
MRAMTRLDVVRASALALAISVPLAVPAQDKPSTPVKPTGAPAAAKGQYAVFETSRGKIGVRLLPAEAPATVANFVELATAKKAFKDPFTGEMRKASYFDGTLFHRVIPGFMIQGGDPSTRDAPFGSSSAKGIGFGTSGPGYEFADELPPAGTIRFDKPCVLAMANRGPDTNGSQFFITEGSGQAVGQLEPRACSSKSGVCGYTRFGQGVCGCDLVPAIALAGNSQTRLLRVTITSTPPTCK